MVLGKLFRRGPEVQEEDQVEGGRAVRVSAGGREVVLERGDAVVLADDPEGQAAFHYLKTEAGPAAASTTPLGEAARRGSRVMVLHTGDSLLVTGLDFRIGAGSGVLHFEKTIQQVPLEREPSFSVEAAGYWATVGAGAGEGGAQASEARVPATRFTVAAYRRVGKVEKVAEIQLEPGDRAIVGRWSEELAEEYGVGPSPENTTVPHILVVDSGGRVKHYGPLGVAADTTVSRTHLVLEVPREGGGLVIQDYGHRGLGSTNGTKLVLEDLGGKPMRLVLQRESTRFYPAAPLKHLTVQLGTSVFLYIEASH